MKINKEPIRKWFGYSRRERRASFMLLLIIVLIIILRSFVPENNMAIEPLVMVSSDRDSSDFTVDGGGLLPEGLFPFDPNRISFDSLIKLGFEVKVANTLINYRMKGGKFEEATDIKKIYGLDGEKAEMLIPFVEVLNSETVKYRDRQGSKQIPKININHCDSAMLERLPGIGPVLSARIIKYRNLLGGFVNPDQLNEVYGLPEETCQLIRDRLEIDSLCVEQININMADYRDLIRHPYLEKYEVAAILKYRELEGDIGSMADIIENKLLSEEKAFKVGPYIKFK